MSLHDVGRLECSTGTAADTHIHTHQHTHLVLDLKNSRVQGLGSFISHSLLFFFSRQDFFRGTPYYKVGKAGRHGAETGEQPATKDQDICIGGGESCGSEREKENEKAVSDLWNSREWRRMRMRKRVGRRLVCMVSSITRFCTPMQALFSRQKEKKRKEKNTSQTCLRRCPPPLLHEAS